MAEEDLLFGRNRHFFGGIEPSILQSFSAASNYDRTTKTPKIKIIGKMPSDTIVNGSTLCTVAGIVIRKSTTGYPENEFDGDLLSEIKVNHALLDPYSFEVSDTNVEVNSTYYYSAFPYSTQGVYSRNVVNRTSAMAEAKDYTYFYGYDLTVSDSNPDTRVIYPSDVDNAGYTAAAMNFSTGVFNYGGWPNSAGDKFMPKPCMLAYNGTVSEYLNPSDYSKTESGSASNVANTSFGGNAMMEWPKIYTKRELVNGVYKFRCCDIAIDDTWDCICNYDANNNIIDHFYTPIYFGSNVSSKLRSISGQSNSVSTTRDTEITLAKANGASWYTEVLADRLLIQDLLVLMAKSTETQTKFGHGRCSSGNSSAIGQGTMNTKGLFWGSNDQTSGVKVFGMENWWGNIWRACAGWINASGTQKVKLTRGTHDGSTSTDYNLDGSGYLTIASATPSGSSGGYISSMKNDLPYGRIPVVASGSSSTYESDGLWFNNGQTDYAVLGGGWNSTLLVGAFCAYLYAAASYPDAGVGASLSCKPLAS